VQYHHPDRRGTRLITNNANTSVVVQQTLPFGTALDSESTGVNTTARRFTSYERSAQTGLDYAVNRHYDARQGRFTQVDPIGMSAVSLANPQTLNLYAYCANDPINNIDPNGLFFGAVFSFVGRFFAGLFGGPGGINVFGSFTYRNLPPVSVSFTNSFNDINVGFGGINFQVKGQNPSSLTHELGHFVPTCNDKFASIFGGKGAVGRTDYDYNGVYRGRNPVFAAQVAGNGRNAAGNSFFDAEHLFNFPHLSGNQAGTENTTIYVPGNYSGRPTGPTPTAGVVTFFYRTFFGRSNVTLAVFHVGNFRLRRQGGRLRIGTTGGPGGFEGGNLHSHFELWEGNTGFLPPGDKRDAARIPLTPIICP
jgi:RHS repeat-associated protein